MEMRSERIALDKVYKRRDRYEIPDWQREEVWNPGKKQKLIDSILRGWKLPKFYFLLTSESPKEYEVLDGQQRLSAIWEFFDNDLKLSEESAEEFGGETYDALPDDVSDAFDDYELNFDVISDADEEDQKEFFQRLQEGLPLTSSEKLNSVHSKLRDYCAKLAKHKFFSETTRVSSKRYAYFDICAKVMALEIEGYDSGTRYDDVKKVFTQQAGFSGNSAVAKRAKKALDILHKEISAPCKQLKNRTLVQSIVSFTCHLSSAGLDAKQHRTLAKFIQHFLTELTRQVERGQAATDQEYVAFQRTVNANVRSGAKTRNDILLRKLFQYSPGFYSQFLQNNSLAAGLADQVKTSAQAIRDLVAQANEKYAARHGKDLFKPTNKTIKALTTKLDKQVSEYDSYKELIENLYFLFRESIGTRLNGLLPESFKDVNDLRTLNEHDVDHGKASKVAKRRKELANVFKKYAGESSPMSIDPGKFIVVQANLLAGLEGDLRVLVKDGFNA